MRGRRLVALRDIGTAQVCPVLKIVKNEKEPLLLAKPIGLNGVVLAQLHLRSRLFARVLRGRLHSAILSG